jgi:ATP-dependent DNA helicase RecG
MPENQNVEYKESWRDEYLKWIAGFANAQGGIIYIGKDDGGRVVGVADPERLMDELPNKIRDVLGIMAEVNAREDGGQRYIEIITPPYAVPISYHGRYYYRSGSTKQELKGNALNEFLLRKSGKTWDEVLELRATIADIDEMSVEQFRRDAARSGRLPDDDHEHDPLDTFLEKLRLIDDGGIKRGALALFGKDSARFFPNLRVQIGRFGDSDDDLKFQEIEEGNLLYLLRAVPEQLNRKFLTRPITFEGLLRIEKGEYPAAALREMLLNALVHRDYMGSSIQIRIHDNKLSIWNEGTLPEGLTLDALKRVHPSRPRNPLIADVCFKGGYIDQWGRGTLKIISVCREAELPEPEIIERDGGFSVTLFKSRYTDEQLEKLGLKPRQVKAIQYVMENGSITNAKYQELLGVSRITATRDLGELKGKGIFEFSGRGASAVYRLPNAS